MLLEAGKGTQNCLKKAKTESTGGCVNGKKAA